MFRRISVVCAALLCVAVCTGCVTLVMKHSPLTPSSEQNGAVSLTVNNAREEDKGGDDEFLVGQTRNMYGMPLKKTSDNSIVQAMIALHTDALAAAGYKVVEGAPTTVVVDVNAFFMDGYMGYKMDAACTIKAMNSGSSSFEKQFAKNHGFHYKNTSSLVQAYDDLMNIVAKEAVAVYQSPDFKAAVK